MQPKAKKARTASTEDHHYPQFLPSLDEVKAIRAKPENSKKRFVPVYRELFADLETPVSAFLKVRQGEYSFLLESVALGEQRGRYSIIGSNPFKILKVGDHEEKKGDPLKHLEAEMKAYDVVSIPGLPLPPFTGGAVGYLGYDAVRFFEGRVRANIDKQVDRLGIPDSVYMFCDTILVFDHVRNTIKAVSHCDVQHGAIEEEYEKATAKITVLIDRLKAPIAMPTVSALRSVPRLPHEEWDPCSNAGKAGYMGYVKELKKHITGGDIIQAVPSHRISVELKGAKVSPFDIYRQLRVVNPSPYMFYLELGKDFQIVGASPEMLLRVDADRMVQTHPIAGTRPRGATPAEDIALEEDLLADEKERAEHVMLVDLGRNDVGRVAKPGTVRVEGLMHVERFSHVMHIVSVVKGDLRDECSPLDAMRAIFPAGTLTGAPKVKAMELVAGLEPEKRGVYGGSVGYYSFSRVLDSAIGIRTLVVKDGVVHSQAGGGIVYDSEPYTEYVETMNKMGAVLNTIQIAAANSGAEVVPATH